MTTEGSLNADDFFWIKYLSNGCFDIDVSIWGIIYLQMPNYWFSAVRHLWECISFVSTSWPQDTAYFKGSSKDKFFFSLGWLAC